MGRARLGGVLRGLRAGVTVTCLAVVMLLAVPVVASAATITETNPTPTGVQGVTTGNSKTEQVVNDMDLTLSQVGDSVTVDVDFWWSMNFGQVTKDVTVRLRRDSLTGEVLASDTKSATVDSSGGHDRRWNVTYTDSTPETGHYVVTVQSVGQADNTIYSDTRVFTLSTDVADAPPPPDGSAYVEGSFTDPVMAQSVGLGVVLMVFLAALGVTRSFARGGGTS